MFGDRCARATTMTGLTAAEATRRYSTAASRIYRLVGPLAGGETGATLIEGIDGDRRVLKWESDPRNQALRSEAVPLADRLRTEARWPVPRQEAVRADEWLFISQEFMSGEPIARLTHHLV